MSLHIYIYTLRIQVSSKKGITPTFLFFLDGIGTLNPIQSGGVWILRDVYIYIYVYINILHIYIYFNINIIHIFIYTYLFT